MKHASLSVSLAALGLVAVAEAASMEKIQELSARSGMEQQSIRSDTVLTREKIAAIRAELLQNGATREDIASLDRALSKLDELTEAQMKKVIASLQSAGAAGRQSDQSKDLLDAYEGQRKALGEIADLVQELRLRNSLRELQAKVRKLLLDQAVNLRATVSLLIPAQNPGESEKERVKLVTTRQTAIEREILSLIEGMEFEVKQEQNSEKQALQSCLNSVAKTNLRVLAPQAAQQTATGAWEQASASQKEVRTALEELAAAYQAVTDPAENLQNALQALADLSADQRKLADYTARERTPDSLAEQAHSQASIQDAAFVLKGSLPALNADAARQLEDARAKMQAAADSLAQKNFDGSAFPSQEGALKALDQARDALQQQLAAMPEELTPQERLAKLEKVQAQIQAELQQSRDLAATPADSAPLAEQISQTQKETLPLSSQAAESLGKAVSDLSPSSPDAASATQNLTEASSALAQEIAEAKTDVAAETAAALADHAVEEALKSTEQAMQSADASKLQDAANEFSDAGKKLDGVSSSALPEDAQKALQDAKTALGAAALDAAQTKGAESKSAGAQAQGALAQAQAALGGKSAGQKGGQPTASKGPGMKGGMPGYSQNTGLLGSSGPDAAAGSALTEGSLKPKDRDAIRQLAKEKVPEEYSPLVQQYMKNLADDSASQ